MNKYEKQALFDGAKEFLNDDLLSRLMGLVAQIEDAKKETPGNEELLKLFETAKNVEGCSPKSMKYYLYVLKAFLSKVTTPVKEITTDDIRNYWIVFPLRRFRRSLWITFDELYHLFSHGWRKRTILERIQ